MAPVRANEFGPGRGHNYRRESLHSTYCGRDLDLVEELHLLVELLVAEDQPPAVNE